MGQSGQTWTLGCGCCCCVEARGAGADSRKQGTCVGNDDGLHLPSQNVDSCVHQTDGDRAFYDQGFGEMVLIMVLAENGGIEVEVGVATESTVRNRNSRSWCAMMGQG